MSTKDTLFTPFATGGDVSYLFRSLSHDQEQETLFSNTSIPSLTKQFTSAPINPLPRQDVPASTLFGAFSNDIQPPLSPTSSILSLPEEITQHTIPDDDLWQHADERDPSSKRLDAWESFGAGRSGSSVHANPFVTEQNPRVFDELLQRDMNHIYSPNESGIVVHAHLFRECLLAVSVGRESSLFQWNENSGFEPVIPKLRVTGISPAAAQSVIVEMCRRGTLFRRLAAVTENILRSPTKYGSIAVSFACAILSITQHWKSQIQQSYLPVTQGLLSLESQFYEIDESLGEIARLCSCDSPIRGQIPLPALGGELLSQLYDTALKLDYPTSSPLRALGITLLQHTSSVFLSLLTYWIGFPSEPRGFSDIKEWYNMDTSREFFIQRAMREEDVITCKTMMEFDSLFEFKERLVPAFVGRDVALKVFEMGRGLRLLWRCQPDHPLCDVFDVAKNTKERLELKWLLSWEEIHETHDRLDEYANNMRFSMEHTKQETKSTRVESLEAADDSPYFGLFEIKEAAQRMLSSRIQEMSLTPEPTSTDTFISDFMSLHTILQSSTSIPLLSLIAQNSFTHALDLQANLIQRALLSLFFNSLDLKRHLSILHSYLLFGNGIFVTRLQEALFEDFDTEDVRGGGQPGLGLGIGFLVGKNVWPPNGAKVGLVLRNVLAETHINTTDPEICFAYRELSEDQFEKVKNPIGLEALDFLQLQYKAPFPLDTIITHPILEQYDQIFLFLLRLFRMQYVSHQLFRDAASKSSYSQGINPLSQRFRIEAHHFITAISGYIFNISITGNWHPFQAYLSTLESTPHAPSIQAIREIHSQTIDKIMYSCFLKRRQQPILTLLYGTFEPILLFAKTSRMYARREQRVWSRMREEMEDNTRILYAQFIKRAGMFVRVIEQLERKGVGKSGYGGVGERGERYERGWFADLLVRLDGSYFDR